MGWLLNYQEQFILIAEESQMEDLTRKLMRIGLDNMLGFVSFKDAQTWGLDIEKVELIDIEGVESIVGDGAVQILDVRNYGEFDEGHIDGADNVFVGTLVDNLDKVNKDKQVVIHCQSGARASIANSLLFRNGFKNVKTYFGGFEEWSNKGNKVAVV